MSMSIGQLMKGLVGDVQVGDGKALELKVGQTVRGVLVKMTGDQEGIVQINGTPVLAKLETPMEAGQAILMQVQPESADGTLVLKQADPKSAGMPEASVKEWMKALGLPDTKASQELVSALRKDGIVLTRELASQFKEALAAMPAGGDVQSWMRAAALAVRRGLPMTSATIGALQQVLVGPPAHELLNALEAGLAAWRGTAGGQDGKAAGGSAQPPSAVQAAAAKLQALLATGAALMREAQGSGVQGNSAQGISAQGSGTQGSSAQGSGKQGSVVQPAAAAVGKASETAVQSTGGAALEAGLTKGGPVGGVAAGLANGSQANGVTNPLPGSAVSSGSAAELTRASQDAQADNAAESNKAAAEGGLKTADGEAGAESARQWGRALLQTSKAQAEPALQQANRSNEAAKQQSSDQMGKVLDGAAQAAGSKIAQPLPQPATSINWVSQLMKWMGVDYERQLATSTLLQAQSQPTDKVAGDPLAVPDNKAQTLKLLNEQLPLNTGQERAGTVPLDRSQQQAATIAASLQNLAPAGDDGKPNAAESLKSTLMTIASSNDVPQQLRDTAQQLVSQITGQQLLLSPEKNGALLSHVSLFIPMKGPDGNQTAAVHIQTRRGRKGELDGDNCRLLFDLRMKTLGDTVVDVQVVNKIVNLHVWNDHPVTAQLVDASRNELTEVLANAGYQLLTLRTEPIPERLADRLNGAGGSSSVTEDPVWSTKPYKGVDFRI